MRIGKKVRIEKKGNVGKKVRVGKTVKLRAFLFTMDLGGVYHPTSQLTMYTRRPIGKLGVNLMGLSMQGYVGKWQQPFFEKRGMLTICAVFSEMLPAQRMLIVIMRNMGMNERSPKNPIVMTICSLFGVTGVLAGDVFTTGAPSTGTINTSNRL